MDCRTLIDVEALMAHAGESGWRIFDCRGSASDPSAGRRAFEAGHIPGARHADLDRVLSDTSRERGGRHPLPARETLARWLGSEGVGPDTRIVAYDDAGGAFAARLWWLCRWLGHPQAAVLDGGWQAWKDAGGGVETGGGETPRPVRFPVGEALVEALDAEAVMDIVRGKRRGRLVDARSPNRFSGASEPLDRVAGHIPGARNLPFSGNLGPGGRFREAGELRERFRGAGGDGGDVVHYCGSGVTACHNVLAMEHAGLPGSMLYAGSWSDWIEDRGRPVETGPEQA